MVIGIPKEIKPYENRVALTPAGVLELCKAGHKVYVQSEAGDGSGIANTKYSQAGATILSSIEEIYGVAEMIVKVKEPVASEYELVKPGQLLFTYFHFASSEILTKAMIKSGGICLAYETVETQTNRLPLLIPMSEVAGSMAVQEGAKYLEKTYNGRGVLLGGVPGVAPAKVLILGGGIAGMQAGKIAAGLGADVTIMDVDLERLRYLADVMPANVRTIISNEIRIREAIAHADLVIGSVLVHGAKTPRLITKDMLPLMRKGTVLVDIAVDQGGCFETSKPTTHDDPVFLIDGIVHYSVSNMPGAVPNTSTMALTNATLPYVLQLANLGWRQACIANNELKKGLNICQGKVVYEAVAEAWNLPYTLVNEMLNNLQP